MMVQVTSMLGVALLCCASVSLADDGAPGFVDRMRIQDATTARVSSWDRAGGNMDFLQPKPGETAVLADIKGPGCITHFYWAYIIEDPAVRVNMLRNMILRVYWDGEKTPSVECPIGDFFGASNGLVRPIRSLDLAVNPGMGNNGTSWGFNCYFPMAFARRARIEMTYDAEPSSTPPGGFWYHVDYETYPQAPKWMAEVGRFHAQFRRANPTKAVDMKGANVTGTENYVILEAAGQGHLAGYMLGVDNLAGGWWGEGDDMVFIDGEAWPPSYHGTGSEEIFGGGACPDVEYTGPYTGFHLVENREGDSWYGKNAMYRLFSRDPVRFRKSIRVTIEHGHANDLANDYSSVGYWYQREPHAPFPAMPDRAGRAPITKYPAGPGDIPGAIEGESLLSTAKTSGAAPTVLRFAGTWSRGRFLWFIGKGPDDFLSVRVPVPADGKYEIAGWMAKATDFGIVQLLVDGKPVGATFDGYNAEGGVGPTHGMRSGEVRFGTVELAAGNHTFEFRLVDKNPAGVGYMIGVDCITLRPARQ